MRPTEDLLRDMAQVLTLAHLAFAVQAADTTGQLAPEPSRHDELYMIIAGYGVLRCSDGELIELTAGDLLFVPAESGARFEDLSRKFKTWRVSLRLESVE
jgi:mannose-6-phosphate isomerase-like protein (cupin superfamily)